MKTWVRKTLSVGVLAAGALLFTSGAAHATEGVGQSTSGSTGLLNGTRIVAPISVPANIVGNAIGVGGEANAGGAATAWWPAGGQVAQGSSDNVGVGNGTQAYVPITVPITVAGNAVGVLGEANGSGAVFSGGQATESGTAVGQSTSDNNGVLDGTQLYSPVTVPVDVCGNSFAGLGSANAGALCTSGGHASVSGSAHQASSDDTGVLNGTQLVAPITLPVNLAGNAVAVAGEANGGAAAASGGGVQAARGAAQSAGDDNGIANGTQIEAPVTTDVDVCGNALSLLGEANAGAGCTPGGAPQQAGTDQTGDHAGDPGADHTADESAAATGNGDSRPARDAAAAEVTPVDGLTDGPVVPALGGLLSSLG